jgi:outer membrane lipoprotein
MIRHPLLRFLASGLFLVAVSACATKPIAKQYRQEAKAEDLTFSMVLQNPDAYLEAIVLWGGIIIETKNLKEGTEMILLETPLGRDERPKSAEHTRGRFIAVSSKFLDPAVYKEGAKITLAGQVAGKKSLTLDKTTYSYPVVTIKQLHLWKKRPRYIYYPAYPYDYWGWGPYWDGWGSYWDWYPGYYDFDQDFEGEQ